MRRFIHEISGGVSIVGILVLTCFMPLQAAALSGASSSPVSADPLPTAQIDGIVRAQVTIGNMVYATGQFAAARPAGVAKGGAGSVTRTNLLAYNITTGVLDTSFVHSLSNANGTAEGWAIAASPDGKNLYVGGTFTTVDGQAHANFVAFSLASNTLLSGFAGTNSKVGTIAATNTRVYLGGSFTSIGGQARSHVAAFDTNGVLAASWKPSITSTNNSFMDVSAMVVAPAQNNLIIGGSFNRVNGLQYLSNVAVKLDTGAPVTPWASTSSSFPIRDQVTLNAPSGNGAEISSLSTDGSQVYLTSWGYGSDYLDGFFEGRAAISPVNGSVIWINDCHGDSYGAIPINGVLYSVSHAHDCRPMGLWGDLPSQHALAETTTGTTGTDVASADPKYPSFTGYKHTDQLNWYPLLNTGTVSGSDQAAWSVTGNSTYISLGGEFTKANSQPQQGLVRYAIRAKAPNKIGPAAFSNYSIAVGKKDASNHPAITITGTSDPDDGTLTYYVYRNGGTTPIQTFTMAGNFAKVGAKTFTDTGATNASQSYSVTAKDPNGNSVSSAKSAVDDTNQAVTYSGSGWIVQQNLDTSRQALGNSIHYTTVNGSSALIHFNGPSITVLTEKSPTRGNIAISLDGGAPKTVSAYAAGDRQPQQAIYTIAGLSSGGHTVSLTKTSGTNMVVDGFVISH